MAKLGFDDRWITLVSSCIQSVSFFVLVMGNPIVCFTLIEVSNKEILYRLTCFSYGQRVFIPLSNKLKPMDQSMVFLFARMTPRFPTYFLHMIAYCSAVRMLMTANL